MESPQLQYFLSKITQFRIFFGKIGIKYIYLITVNIQRVSTGWTSMNYLRVEKFSPLPQFISPLQGLVLRSWNSFLALQ